MLTSRNALWTLHFDKSLNLLTGKSHTAWIFGTNVCPGLCHLPSIPSGK